MPKKDRHRADGELFSLDIPSYRSFSDTRTNQAQVELEPFSEQLSRLAVVKGTVLYLRGVSENEAEETLRKSEERLRLAAQAGKMYSFEWDITTDTVLRSPEHVRVLGVTEPLCFTHRQYVDRIHPDDRPTFLATIAGLTPENPSGIVSYRLCSSDGGFVWLRSSGRAFFDDEGKMLRVIGMVADVTDQKLTEEALRASEGRLRLAQQAARIGTFERDVRTGRITWSEGLEPLYGLSPGSLGGKTPEFFKDLIHPNDRERAAQLIQQALKSGQPTEGEWRAIWPDGSVHWIVSRWQVLMDDSGGPSRVVGVNMDVTERKQTEQALRESEERLRLATQAARMFAYSWDATTDVIERSGESAEILGVEQGAVGTGAAILAMVHPADKERLETAMANLTVETPRLAIAYRIIRPDGAVIWLDRNSRAYFDEHGKIKRIVGMVVDITERKLAEEALRKSEERLRMAQWAAHIGTFDVNLRTGVNIWTPETEALYGLPPGSFGGTLAAFENLIHPDDQKRVVELTHEMMRTGQPMEAEWRVIWPEGSVHWIAGRGQVFMDESGEPSRMLGVNLDITERKRTEEALSTMPRRLIQSQEQERTRIARELHDDISQRLALVAMDLDRQSQDLQASAKEMRLVMQQATKQVSDLVSDLHEMSHRLHSSKLDTVGLVAAAASFCREFAERQNVKVDFHSEGVPKKVPVDVSLCLFRVLQEALQNAAKHSGAKHYRVSLLGSTNQIALAVSDKGRGFDLTEALKGNGLGITSMVERTKQVGGQLLIEVGPGGGTTIDASVPLNN